MIKITRRIEFDAGHRIPNHSSECRNLHGHRYAMEITLEGEIINKQDASECGMVMDFADIKKIAKDHLIDKWDHAFLVYKKDTAVCEFLQTLPNHKTIILDKVPTVENLALIAFHILEPLYKTSYNQKLNLAHIRLFETAHCWADVSANNIKAAI